MAGAINDLDRLINEGTSLHVLSQAPTMAAVLKAINFEPHREFAKNALHFIVSEFGPDSDFAAMASNLILPSGGSPLTGTLNVLQAIRRQVGGNAALTDITFEFMLHSIVRDHAYAQFRNGHFRDAVFNSILAVFDHLRERSALQLDGAALVTTAFSLQAPRLLIADITTDSGRSEQAGFIQILQGVYSGVRNPKAHSLRQNTDQLTAAQYLVFASLLARRIDEARRPAG